MNSPEPAPGRPATPRISYAQNMEDILLDRFFMDKRGTYLDVAMTDNVFPFLYWAIGKGFGTGKWPGNGTDLVTYGSYGITLLSSSQYSPAVAAGANVKLTSSPAEPRTEANPAAVSSVRVQTSDSSRVRCRV